jgi:Predicted transcriptional regulators
MVEKTVCPIAKSQLVVGDRWTMLILRELFMGNCRFEGLQAQTEATPQMLAARIKKLEADGMTERFPYNTRPLRYEYKLTAKGQAFFPVVLALRAWGETWCKLPDEGLAVRLIHLHCGQDAGLGPTCQSCGAPLYQNELIQELGSKFKKERAARNKAFRTRTG